MGFEVCSNHYPGAINRALLISTVCWPPRVVTFPWWGDSITSMTQIAMLAGVYTPGRASQVRQVER